MNIELHRHARRRALAGANDGIRHAPRQAVSLGATAVLFGGALAACGGTTNAVVVPNSDQKNYKYGPNYIKTFVATAVAAGVLSSAGDVLRRV